jgi:hypothetical protein
MSGAIDMLRPVLFAGKAKSYGNFALRAPTSARRIVLGWFLLLDINHEWPISQMYNSAPLGPSSLSSRQIESGMATTFSSYCKFVRH